MRSPSLHEDWSVEDAVAQGWWYGTTDPAEREAKLREAYRVARGIRVEKVMADQLGAAREYDFWRHLEIFGRRDTAPLTFWQRALRWLTSLLRRA